MSRTNFFRHFILLAVLIAVLWNGHLSAEPNQNQVAPPGDFKLTVSFHSEHPDQGSAKGVTKVIFSNHYCVSAKLDTRYGEDWDSWIVFDLENMAFFEVDLKRWTDLKTCKEWEQQSLKRVWANMKTSNDAAAKAFTEASINPRFQLTKTSGEDVVISNTHLTCTVTPLANVSQQKLKLFLAYDRLNGYRNAMEQRMLPPTSELAFDDLLAKHNLFPKNLSMRLKMPEGDVTTTVEYRLEVPKDRDMNEFEKALAAAKETK